MSETRPADPPRDVLFQEASGNLAYGEWAATDPQHAEPARGALLRIRNLPADVPAEHAAARLELADVRMDPARLAEIAWGHLVEQLANDDALFPTTGAAEEDPRPLAVPDPENETRTQRLASERAAYREPEPEATRLRRTLLTVHHGALARISRAPTPRHAQGMLRHDPALRRDALPSLNLLCENLREATLVALEALETLYRDPDANVRMSTLSVVTALAHRFGAPRSGLVLLPVTLRLVLRAQELSEAVVRRWTAQREEAGLQPPEPRTRIAFDFRARVANPLEMHREHDPATGEPGRWRAGRAQDNIPFEAALEAIDRGPHAPRPRGPRLLALLSQTGSYAAALRDRSVPTLPELASSVFREVEVRDLAAREIRGRFCAERANLVPRATLCVRARTLKALLARAAGANAAESLGRIGRLDPPVTRGNRVALTPALGTLRGNEILWIKPPETREAPPAPPTPGDEYAAQLREGRERAKTDTAAPAPAGTAPSDARSGLRTLRIGSLQITGNDLDATTVARKLRDLRIVGVRNGRPPIAWHDIAELPAGTTWDARARDRAKPRPAP